MDVEGCLGAIVGVLRYGNTIEARENAAATLFSLSAVHDYKKKNSPRRLGDKALAGLLTEGTPRGKKDAPLGAEAVAKEENAVTGLIGMMRCGTPRGKENAVAALLELCRSGGAAATERVVKAPALAGLLQILLFTGTKRARRKAASLARVFQRCENASRHFGGLGFGYGYAGNSAVARETSFFQ
ncbi:UNVERIFIED_CONTAM: U-box domain-containing protein 17 [Sesamum radiatum]|uniref:U-box domain-containing protein 17 n=1 Tax=Sesamum radiatum TaxID=300843 RepID=A0AAW2K1S0_SESRA